MGLLKSVLSRIYVGNGRYRVFEVSFDKDFEVIDGRQRKLTDFEMEQYNQIGPSTKIRTDYYGNSYETLYAIFDQGYDTKIRFKWGPHHAGHITSGTTYAYSLELKMVIDAGDLWFSGFDSPRAVAASIMSNLGKWRRSNDEWRRYDIFKINE